MVNHQVPQTYQEALEWMQKDHFYVMAGGTDLMIQKRSMALTPPKMDRPCLFVFNLNELKYVNKRADGIAIGSMTSLETLLDHPDVPLVLKKVIGEMASPALRYVATLAGNIANASPAGDSLLALYLLDAVVVLESLSRGIRKVPIEHFIIGPRQTTIEPDEIIKEIHISDLRSERVTFVKVGGRKADAISKVSFLALFEKQENRLEMFRSSIGAVAKTVIRDKEIERILTEQPIDQLKENPEMVLTLYEPLIQPIDDQRSNKRYRKTVALNLIKDFIDHL